MADADFWDWYENGAFTDRGPSTRVVKSVANPNPPIVWNDITPVQEQAMIYRNGGPTRPASGGALPTRTVDQMYLGIYPSQPGQFRVGSTDGLGAGKVGGQVAAANLTGKVNEQGKQIASASWALPAFAALGGAASPSALGYTPVASSAPSTSAVAATTVAAAPSSVPRWIASMPAAQAYTAPVPVNGLPQPSLWASDPMQFGQNAVSQSGDTSVGNQLEAAAARSSGEGGRTRRY